MRPFLAASALAALALAPPARAIGDSIACDRGIVQVGDTKVDLLGKCGEPTLRDARQVETGAAVVQAAPLALDAAATTTTVEQWTFNFGPNRFVMIVNLEGGRVASIERGSYGYAPERLREPRGVPPCESSAVRVGDRKLDLLAKCGEPTARDVSRVKRATSAPVPARDGATAVGFTTVEVETWTYDLGPQRFVTIATLERGQVVAVEHGGYGYRR